MAYRLLCPQCGAAVHYTAEDIGADILCTACGTRLQAPPGDPAASHLTAEVSTAFEPDPTFRLTDRPDAFQTERAAVAAAPTAWERVAVKRRRRVQIRIAIAASAGVALLGGVLLYLKLHPAVSGDNQAAAVGASSDAQFVSELQRLKSTAERQAASGQLEAADAQYRALALFGKTQRESSPAARQLLELADADHRKVLRILQLRATAVATRPVTRPVTLPTAGIANAASRSRTGEGPSAVNSGELDFTNRRTSVPVPIPAPATRPATVPAQPVAPPPGPRPGGGPTEVARVNGVALRPVDPALAAANPAVLDAAVEQSIRHATDYLLMQFNAAGELPRQSADQEMYRYGLHALCAYAILSAGRATHEPRYQPGNPLVTKIIDQLKTYPIETNNLAPPRPVTYGRSLRAAALAVYDRAEDHERLRSDVAWLVAAHNQGGYTYDDRYANWKPADSLDNPSTPGFGPGSGLGLRPVRPGSPQGMGIGQTSKSPIGGSPPPFNMSIPTAPGQPAAPQIPQQFVHPSSGRIVGGSGMIGGGVMGGGAVVPPGMGLSAFRRRPGGWGPQNGGAPPASNTPPGNVAPWDHSNSQLAVWAVYLGSERGVKVPTSYWEQVQRHWVQTDLPSGGWCYEASDPLASLSMTAGGLASLLAATERLGQASFATKFLNDKPPPEIALAVNWLSSNDAAVTLPGSRTRFVGYDLFALSRAGMLGGNKYLGPHDWYRDLAGRAVVAQREDGSWGVGAIPPGGGGPGDPQAVVDTAFHLLFLSTGRHPVMMNKLRHSGGWSARPRDVANATVFAAKDAGLPLNWQVVSTDQPATDWLDSPVLFVSSDSAVRFTESDISKLRDYAIGGGILMLHCDYGARAANTWANQLCEKLFPQYEVRQVDGGHPLYTTPHRVKPDERRLRMVTNGSRILALIAADDLGSAWQERDEANKPAAFKLAANLFNYAHGRIDPRPKLCSSDIPAPAVKPTTAIAVAQVRWKGNSNPEPGAWARFGRMLQWETGATINLLQLTPGELSADATPLAHLTGTGAFAMTDGEAAELKRYVAAGGVLLIDACGGDVAFAHSVEARLPAIFPGIDLKPADMTAAPLAKKYDVMDDLSGPPALRPYSNAKLAGKPAEQLKIARIGHGAVIYTPMDLSSAMVGSTAWGIDGYTPDYAAGLVKNIVIWAAAR